MRLSVFQNTTSTERPFARPIPGLLDLLSTYLRPLKGRVTLLALTLLLTIALSLASPQIIRAFIDDAQSAKKLGLDGLFLGSGLLFLALSLGRQILYFVSIYIGEKIGWAATNSLRADLTRHLLRLDLGFHKANPPGQLIEQVDGDISLLGGLFSRFVVDIVGNALFVLGVLVLLAREDLRLGLGMAVYCALLIIALTRLQGLTRRRWSEEREVSAGLSSFLEERLQGLEEIRSSGAEGQTLGQLDARSAILLEKRRLAEIANSLGYFVMYSLFGVGYALALGLGAYLYLQGGLTIGTVYVVVYYVGTLATPIDALRRQLGNLARGGACIGRISALFATKPAVEERSAKLAIFSKPSGSLEPDGPSRLEYRDVSFSYRDEPATLPATLLDDNRKDDDHQSKELDDGAIATETEGCLALDGVSIDLASGESLALLGRTGSGKSTFARLAFRLYDPTAGAILLGGIDLRDLSLTEVHRRVGFVTQDVQLFAASLRDNLTLFGQSYSQGKSQSDEALLDALGELQIREWALALPEGLDTRLGAGGRGLSAGEAQLEGV